MPTKSTLQNSNYNIEESKLNYRGNIPFYVLFDTDLIANELRLYGLIEQMESCLSDVYMNDRSIAKILGVDFDGGMVRRMARKLREKNYIKREQKEVIIKGKSYLKYCWNTVKGGFVVDEQHEIDELNPVLPVPPTPVLPVPPTPVLPVPPYINEVSSKAINNNVCVKEEKPTQKITFEDYKIKELASITNVVYENKKEELITECLNNKKCHEEFESNLGQYDVTFEEVLSDCIEHYTNKSEPQLVSPQRFLQWIRTTKPEIKGYKTKKQKESEKKKREFNEDELLLLQDYKFQLKNPDMSPILTGYKLVQAKELYDYAQTLAQCSTIEIRRGSPSSINESLTGFKNNRSFLLEAIGKKVID